jgi:hypothetical protein
MTEFGDKINLNDDNSIGGGSSSSSSSSSSIGGGSGDVSGSSAMLSSVILRRILWWQFRVLSEELAASIFRVRIEATLVLRDVGRLLLDDSFTSQRTVIFKVTSENHKCQINIIRHECQNPDM